MNRIIVLALMVSLFSYTNPSNPKEGLKEPVNTANVKNDKAFVAFRIGTAQSLPEQRFNKLLDLFDKYKGVTDEITFFTTVTHAPLTLEEFSRRIGILKQRMEQARQQGYRTGINILTTIGHHNENLENSLKGDYTYMTNIDGDICHGSFCPNDDNMREYIRTIYELTTEAKPDYIWIDDDVRLGHMPIGYGCFCDNCLKIFEQETGTRYTRESLQKAFNEGATEEKLKVREEWLQHNRNTIARLFTLIEETVHGIRPDMPLGFMTGDRFFEGYDFDNWAKILAGPDNAPVMWRPGGGFYGDTNTRGLVEKSHAMGRQVSLLPEDISMIQSEIENFPYQRLKKAANIVALEACSHIAAGCTGAAFNVLSINNESLNEYEPLVKKLYDTRPFFDMMVNMLGRSDTEGVQLFWNKNSFVTTNLTRGEWLNGGIVPPGEDIYSIGLPACYSGKNARVTVITGNNIHALSKEKIKELLYEGVYMDAETLHQLNEMGFGELTGFEVESSADVDRIEKFTNHPFNSSFVGWERDPRQSFWKSTAYTFRKTNDNAEILSALIDYTGEEISDCTMGMFENKLGGRICVSGYYPWTFVENLSKSSQMKNIFRWLSKDNLPGYI
ncbi:hypothetical protein, partial [Mariniphaga sediminis]|uniref:hypothetical protein n=1 Tax=Mariniphaga sediminis TaxID=1628158 RepID=UPI0035667E18